MKLAKFVKMHNISAKTLADASGLSIPTINSYIDGTRMPSVEKAFKIEKITLGIVKATDFIDKKKRSAAKQTP